MSRLISQLSVIPMRREASDRSEMTNQILFGETMLLLDETEKWYMVRLDHDAYEGWVDKKQVILVPPDFLESNQCITRLFEQATMNGNQRRILPAGSMIPKTIGQRFHLNRTAYELHAQSTDVSGNILHDAFMFLGSPYLWGGRTFMGIDCSGFTQIVMRMHGLSIPRDAWQQAETGETVAFVEESKTGDLAFFDNSEGRITHVGIVYLDIHEQKKIIHASGQVRADTLDHQGIFNVETGTYSHNLRIIKRVKI